MKQIVFIGLILLLEVHAVGQTQNVDSLENVLKTQELTSEKKMQLYWDILLCYWNTDLEKNISYATEALDHARKEQDFLWSARFSRVLGISYTFKSEFDLALQYLEKAIEYATKANDLREKNAAYMQMGNVYLTAGDKESALQYYTDVLIPLEENQQYEVYTNTLFNIGNIHFDLHNNEKALEYFRKGLTVAEKHSITRSIASLNAAIGNFFSSQHQLDSAVMYVHKSYDIAHEINDIPQIIISSQMLAGMYSDLKDYDKAKKYVDECLDVATKFGDKLKLIAAWTVKAKVSFEMQDYKESETYAYKAWEADSTNLSMVENAVAYLCLSNIYLGNAKKASHFLNQYKTIRDQLNAKSLHNSLVDMEVKYETEKKEIHIASLEKERKLYVWLGISGVLLAFALIILLWQTKRNARKEKQLIATRSILDGEMRERARLAQDLHDRLSGNLSAVKIELGNQTETLQTVRDKLDNCIRDIRDAAHNLMPTSLQSGMKVALEDYTAQFPNAKFHFFGEEKRIDGRLEFIVYCCAAELVNNAIKHSGAENINLQLVQDEKHVTLTVSDDGCGYDEKAAVKGFGLKSIQDRVASCNGKIDIVTSPNNGTETTIELKTDNA